MIGGGAAGGWIQLYSYGEQGEETGKRIGVEDIHYSTFIPPLAQHLFLHRDFNLNLSEAASVCVCVCVCVCVRLSVAWVNL